MTKQKDQKRLIRARMQKTGESYTAARAVLLARKPTTPPAAAPKKDWPTLAGMSDTKVKERTGHTWAGWVASLDAVDAHRMSHRDIARHVRDAYEDVDDWWAQTVTVGYERIRGLRDVGQRRGGTYDANKSRTYPTDVATLYAMLRDPRRRKRWLPEGFERVRTATEQRSIRIDWHDGTQVDAYFTAKGTQKATLTIQHGKLASRAAVEHAKAFWHERLDALRNALR